MTDTTTLPPLDDAAYEHNRALCGWDEWTEARFYIDQKNEPPVLVSGWVFGWFGINSWDGKSFSVTHLPSGLAVRKKLTEGQAMRLTCYITKLDGWDFRRYEETPDSLKPVVRSAIAKAMGSEAGQ